MASTATQYATDHFRQPHRSNSSKDVVPKRSSHARQHAAVSRASSELQRRSKSSSDVAAMDEPAAEAPGPSNVQIRRQGDDAHMGPRRKSKGNISGMHALTSLDGGPIRRHKTDHRKASQASLKQLVHEADIVLHAQRNRANTSKHLAVDEDDEWVSASGGSSAQETPVGSPGAESEGLKAERARPSEDAISSTPKASSLSEARVRFPSTFDISPPEDIGSPYSRKVSGGSTLAPSVRSSRASKAPVPPGMKRVPTVILPTLTSESVTGSFEPAVDTHSPILQPGVGHQRNNSLASISSESKGELSRRLKEASEGSTPRRRVVSTASGGGESTLSRLSGHFGSLRNLAALATSGDKSSPANGIKAASSIAIRQPGTKRSSLLISKFISPTGLATSPASQMSTPPKRPESTPTLSRTQARMLLERDQPLDLSHPGPCTATCASLHVTVPLLPPAPAPADLNRPAHRIHTARGLQRWAVAIVKEADRIDRCHESVRRHSSPMIESYARVLAEMRLKRQEQRGRTKAAVPKKQTQLDKVSQGKPVRPASLQRSQTTK